MLTIFVTWQDGRLWLQLPVSPNLSSPLSKEKCHNGDIYCHKSWQHWWHWWRSQRLSLIMTTSVTLKNIVTNDDDIILQPTCFHCCSPLVSSPQSSGLPCCCTGCTIISWLTNYHDLLHINYCQWSTINMLLHWPNRVVVRIGIMMMSYQWWWS